MEVLILGGAGMVGQKLLKKIIIEALLKWIETKKLLAVHMFTSHFFDRLLRLQE